MISTPLSMEKPVRRPIVPPIRPNWASTVTFILCMIYIGQDWGLCNFVKNLLTNSMLIQNTHLHIPLNLIKGCRVKENVNCLERSMLYKSTWNTNVTNLILAQKELREAITCQLCSFFKHCLNGGGGSNPCWKILLQIFYYSKGLFGNIKLTWKTFLGQKCLKLRVKLSKF